MGIHLPGSLYMKIYLTVYTLLLLSPRLFAQSRCAAAFIPGSNQLVYHTSYMDSLLSSREATAFFYGETHNAHFEPEWKFHFIRHLHDRYGIKDVIMEIGHAAAYLYNQYLQTGDTSLIKGLVYTEAYYMNFWESLHQYNLTLPLHNRLIIHGVDFERPEAVKVLKLLRVSSTVPASLQPIFAKMEQGEQLPDFSESFKDLWAQIRQEFTVQDAAVQELYLTHYSTVQKIIRNSCPVTARAVPRDMPMFANLSAVLRAGDIKRFVGFFGHAHTSYRSSSSLPNQMKKVPGFASGVLSFGPVYKDAYTQGRDKQMISYTGMHRKAVLKALYSRYMEDGCRAAVVPATQLSHRRMSATADYFVFAQDVIVP